MLIFTRVLLAVIAAHQPFTLVDHPIASGFDPVYLDGNNWTAANVPSVRIDSAYSCICDFCYPAVRAGVRVCGCTGAGAGAGTGVRFNVWCTGV